MKMIKIIEAKKKHFFFNKAEKKRTRKPLSDVILISNFMSKKKLINDKKKTKFNFWLQKNRHRNHLVMNFWQKFQVAENVNIPNKYIYGGRKLSKHNITFIAFFFFTLTIF